MKDLKKYAILPVEPDIVYAALTREATVQLWTGSYAEMEAKPGAEFSMWDDDIVGKFLELDPGKKIVQQWYFGDDQEDSIVTIVLHPHKKGTSMEIRHTGIPDDFFENIEEGWDDVYIAALADFFDEESEAD
ncbi:MAG: ATPase [Bacteroidetes bacterium]|nr:ATPase [Bacteroidota bacterium]